MPAAQGEVTNREVRFTLRFRRTITIAAASVSSSFVIGPAQHAAQCRGPADDRGIVRLLRPIREYHGAPEPKFASDDAPAATGGSETAEACERSIWIEGDFSAGRLRRRLSERSGESGQSGKRSVPGTRAFRGQVRPEGTRASANTSGPDFMPGFGPDETAGRKGYPHRTKKNLFLLPDRF